MFTVVMPKFKILQNLVDRLNLVTREIPVSYTHLLLISILVLTMINIFFVECRYSLFKIDEKVLENIEEKNKLSVSRCKKIKSKEKEFLSVCQLSLIHI